MSNLQLHFLKTANDGLAMLLTHPSHNVLFDAPLDVDPPYEPNVVMITKNSEDAARSASMFHLVRGTPIAIAKLDAEDLSIEPHMAVPEDKAYGYMIKSKNISIAYAPYLRRSQPWIGGADIAIVDSSCTDLAQIAKTAQRVYVTNIRSNFQKSALAETLTDGDILTIASKQTPTLTKRAARYRQPAKGEGSCGECLHYCPPAPEVAEVEKAVESTEHQVRIRVASPNDFEPGSFRTKELDPEKGISAILGHPRGRSSMAVQALRFDTTKEWTEESAQAWTAEHNYSIAKSAPGTCNLVIGDISAAYTCDDYEPTTLAPLEEVRKSVRQAFGSPGGKRAMAKRLVSMLPDHATYVEPYAGGAALFFAKEPSKGEVLNDLDTNIATAYKDLAEIDDASIRKLQRHDWTVSKNTFKRLKNKTANSAIGRLYTFLYKRGAAYGNYTQPSASHEGKVLKVANRIPAIRDRLQGVTVLNTDALEVIKKYDSPDTFFFLDPPYPTEWKFDGNTGSANANEWQGKDLHALLELLKTIKGKFILTLEEEIEKLMPDQFEVHKITMQRQMSLGPKGKMGEEDELIVCNFPLQSEHLKSASAVQAATSDMELFFDVIDETESDTFAAFAKSSAKKKLLWTVNMVPYKVDIEGHWQDEDEIMQVAHNFLLKDIPIWEEHVHKVNGVFPVQSFTLLADLHIKKSGGERIVPKGSWVTVLWFENDEEWAKVESGDYTSTSVRGFARKRPGSPPADKRLEAKVPAGA